MIQVKCIQKFRDKQNRIYGYRLMDLNQQTQDVTPENLKKAIKSGKINVVNLTLTSNGRLVDTTEKLLQNKELGKAPIVKQNIDIKENTTVSDTAKALAYIDDSFTDMRYTSYQLTEDRCQSVGIKYTSDNKEYFKYLAYAHENLLNTNIKEEIGYLRTIFLDSEDYDYKGILEKNIQYENVDNLNKSKTFKSIYIVYKYLKDNKLDSKLTKSIKEFLDRLKTTGIRAINIGYNIGHTYYKYLDKELFGTITNDVYTVGNTITSAEKSQFKVLKDYVYILHKTINISGSPAIDLACMFKNGDNNNVIMDIKLARKGYIGECVVSIIGYFGNLGMIQLDTSKSIDELSKQVADKLNTLPKRLYTLADLNQSLYSLLPKGKPMETNLRTEDTYTDEQMLHLAISRWTKIRGDRTEAKIERIDRSGEGLRVLYSNNISNNSNKLLKLVASYRFNDDMFTIRVIDSGYLNNTLFSESAPISGNIKENSVIISEVLANALIKANVKRI